MSHSVSPPALNTLNNASIGTLDPVLDFNCALEAAYAQGINNGDVGGADDIQTAYRRLTRSSRQQARGEARFARSIWAKRTAEALVQRAARTSSTGEARAIFTELRVLQTLLDQAQIETLVALKGRLNDHESRERLALLLADSGDPVPARAALRALGASRECLRRLGPPPIKKFRPMRKSSGLDPFAWLLDSAQGDYVYVDGDPDRVLFRGIEFRSGDIGIVETNHPGDGLLDSFLVEPGVAPHAGLFVTLRVKNRLGETEFRPAVFEIYELGWRVVPLSTYLGPDFFWYGEWVRLRALPAGIGPRLSEAVLSTPQVAFDFSGRRAPRNGIFPPGEPIVATCTNLVRLPFEKLGISLPYAGTAVGNGARRNIEILSHDTADYEPYTASNILLGPEYDWVGLVDNGVPEWGLAQAVTVGRPEILHSFGGYMSNWTLDPERLPRHDSAAAWLRRPRSSLDSLLIAIGQSDGMFADAARAVAGHPKESIPIVPPEVIAFYQASDLEAAEITRQMRPAVLNAIMRTDAAVSLGELLHDDRLRSRVREKMRNTRLLREGWYRESN